MQFCHKLNVLLCLHIIAFAEMYKLEIFHILLLTKIGNECRQFSVRKKVRRLGRLLRVDLITLEGDWNVRQ